MPGPSPGPLVGPQPRQGDRDVVDRGAFAASLRKRGASRVKMLWQHDPGEPIGAWLSIEEDARGLKVRGRLNLAVARAYELVGALVGESPTDPSLLAARREAMETLALLIAPMVPHVAETINHSLNPGAPLIATQPWP